MYHPTTRVLAVLELLQAHGRLSGAEMSRRLGIDPRTLRRYIAILEELGIPITTERGRHGGYLLVPGFKLPPMMFTEDEALALSIGLLAARGLGLADFGTAVASAQAKLERVLPNGLKHRLQAVGDTVSLDFPTTMAPRGNTSALLALSAAAQARTRVQLSYRSALREHTVRELDPYGLAYRGGSWYVVGHCHLRGGLRSFRLDRIVDVVTSPHTFTPPAKFDALAQLTFSVASLPRLHAIEVQLAADIETARALLPGWLGVIEPIADGVLLHAQADDLDWFARVLANLPFDFQVRCPAALRQALGRQGERLMAHASTDSANATSPAQAKRGRAGRRQGRA